MTYRTILLAGASSAALTLGGAASAEVTAQQVWSDWQQSMALYGKDVVTIGSEEMSGDTLTLSDVEINMRADPEVITATVEEITFRETGDGSVEITLSEENPLTIEATDDEGAPVTVDMTMVMDAMTILASGDPDAIDYALEAAGYGIVVNSVTSESDPVEGDMQLMLNDVTGSFTTRVTDTRTMIYALDAASVDVLLDVTDPQAPGSSAKIDGTVDGLTTNATIVIPEGVDLEDSAAAFDAGFSVVGSYSFGGSKYTFDVAETDGKISGDAQSGGGNLAFSVDGEALAYDATTTDVIVKFVASQMPIPVTLEIAEYGASLLMPLSESEEPAPFGMSIGLIDLAVNEEIWGMVDPQNILPHDPATISLDLSGMATLFLDFMNPDDTMAMEQGEVPGELNSITLDDLRVAAAGAELTGEGSFDIDNETPATGLNLPMTPVGSLTLNLTGANDLMDRLVQMGLLREDQIMGARMMMGMFAVPTGEDAVTSTIEINEEGHLSANGQRLQ